MPKNKSLLEQEFDDAEELARQQAKKKAEDEEVARYKHWQEANNEFPEIIAGRFGKLSKKVELTIFVQQDYKRMPLRYAEFEFRGNKYFLLEKHYYVPAWNGDGDSGGDYWTSVWVIRRNSHDTNMEENEIVLDCRFSSKATYELSEKVEQALRDFPRHAEIIREERRRRY